MKVLRESHEMIISQQKFTLELLSEYNCDHLSLLSSSLDTFFKLSTSEEVSKPAWKAKLLEQHTT